MIVYPKVSGGDIETLDKTILVKNVNDVPLNITLVIDKTTDGEKFLELVDSQFVLKAGEERKARFKIHPPAEGTYEGKINVFFTPFDKQLGVVLTSDIVAVAGEEGEENTTGNVISGNIGKVLIFGLGTLILIVILVVLIYLLKKNGVKKGGRINGYKKT